MAKNNDTPENRLAEIARRVRALLSDALDVGAQADDSSTAQGVDVTSEAHALRLTLLGLTPGERLHAVLLAMTNEIMEVLPTIDGARLDDHPELLQGLANVKDELFKATIGLVIVHLLLKGVDALPKSSAEGRHRA